MSPTSHGGVCRFAGALIVCAAALVVFTSRAHTAGAQQQPVFRSGVELVIVDVQVVDKKGQPMAALRADQFEVTIDGRRRQVVSAQLVDASTGVAAPIAGAPAEPAPSRPIEPGNVYVLAVDQGSFRAVNAPSVMHAVREFVKRLTPNDHFGVVAYPQPGITIQPTRDHASVTEAIGRIVGFTAVRPQQRFRFTLSEALDVVSREPDARRRALERYCPPGDQHCAQQLQMEIEDTIGMLEMQATRSIDGLRGAIAMVGSIPGRKTMVVISAGIPSGDRSGWRLDHKGHAIEAGKLAAEAGVLLYTLHLNAAFLDAFSPDTTRVSETIMREAGVYARGLEFFNGSAGGTFLEVNTSSDFAIDRVIRESTKYYLLGVEPQDADRDGKPHRIAVKVKAGGSNVRSRAMVVIPSPKTDKPMGYAFATATDAGRSTSSPIRYPWRTMPTTWPSWSGDEAGTDVTASCRAGSNR